MEQTEYNMKPGKDFNGVDLYVGDTVAFIAPYVKALSKGKVVHISPKMIHVEWTSTRTWGANKGKPEVILRNPEYVTKITAEAEVKKEVYEPYQY
jgi:hypothetical protein